MIAFILAGASLAIWVVLVFGRAGFWRGRERDDALASDPAPTAWPTVTAVVPARDEAETIGRAIASLLAQNYPGPFRIVLVDDGSRDATAETAREAERASGTEGSLTIVTGRDLPAGWTGKLWAMSQGVAEAEAGPERPAYILFCDADIEHAPDLVRTLVKGAEARGLALASLMARLNCESAAERWLIPAFIFFFQKLYPFTWVNDPARRVAAAAGGCMLVRAEALHRAGGIAVVKGALIDDCALGAALKRQGPIWLGLTDRVMSLRRYPRLHDIRRMVVRTAYAELRYSPLRLVGALLGMGVTYLVPPATALLAGGEAAVLGMAAWLLMITAYAPTLRFYGLHPLRGMLLPVVAALYTVFTVESALAYATGRGGAWKGRYQAPARSGIARP